MLRPLRRLALAVSVISGALFGVVQSSDALSTRSTPASCSPAWVAQSKSPIVVNFAEGMGRNPLGGSGNYGALVSLIRAFNKLYAGKIIVNDLNVPGGSMQTWNSYTAAIQSQNSVPNLMLFDQSNAQSAADTGTILPISTCMNTTKFNRAPFLPKVLGAYASGSSIIGMPFSVTVPVMLYNKQAFAQAKISGPPNTMAKLIADQHLLQKTSWMNNGVKTMYANGVSITNSPWELTSWFGLNDQTMVNNGNGHARRASSTTLTAPDTVTYMDDLQQIAKNASGANVYDASSAPFTAAFGNIFDIVNGRAGITFDSTATLHELRGSLLVSKNVSLGVAKLPSISGSARGSVPPNGNGLFINKSASSPQQVAAAWLFVQYLTSVNSLTAWDRDTGFLPIRTDELSSWMKAIPSNQRPWFLVGYDSLTRGRVDFATYGALLGPAAQVNNDLTSALQVLLTAPFSTSAANDLAIARTNANADITAYQALSL